jgi:hypothetical protein
VYYERHLKNYHEDKTKRYKYWSFYLK